MFDYIEKKTTTQNHMKPRREHRTQTTPPPRTTQNHRERNTKPYRNPGNYIIDYIEK